MNDCEMDGDYDDVTVRNLLKGEWEWERVRKMTLWRLIDEKMDGWVIMSYFKKESDWSEKVDEFMAWWSWSEVKIESWMILKILQWMILRIS